MALIGTQTSTSTYYLSEGATGSFFDLDILIANPNAADAPVTLTFLREDGGVVTQQRTVPAMQRITVRVDDIAGVEDTPVSTVVTSTMASPLIVERTMRWDRVGIRRAYRECRGRHGADVVFRRRFAGILLDLSAARESGYVGRARATVQYLREGMPAMTRSYPIGGRTRASRSTRAPIRSW